MHRDFSGRQDLDMNDPCRIILIFFGFPEAVRPARHSLLFIEKIAPERKADAP